jgi:hypothetical protein
MGMSNGGGPPGFIFRTWKAEETDEYLFAGYLPGAQAPFNDKHKYAGTVTSSGLMVTYYRLFTHTSSNRLSQPDLVAMKRMKADEKYALIPMVEYVTDPQLLALNPGAQAPTQ